VLGIVVALAWAATGCQQSAEVARAQIAERRASWAREIAGIKEQNAALLARLGGRGVGSGASAAAVRMRATLDGGRQSIADVENQLAQAATRMEEATRRGGRAAEQAIEEESVRVRGYLQALGEQLGATARQLDEFGNQDTERQSP
jgi:hypothetical protein